MSNLHKRYPCVSDLDLAAKRRMPRFAHDVLVGGLGREDCLARNLADLRAIRLMPRYLADAGTVGQGVRLFDREYDSPFGVAPIGLGGLLWPGSEVALASAARRFNVPYILSTFAISSLEAIQPVAGDNGWFQLYPPNDPSMEADLVRRARDAGYRVLMVTVDIPGPTRRERDLRNGLSWPPTLDMNVISQILRRPRWALQTLARGLPDFANLTPYYPPNRSFASKSRFLADTVQGHITRDRLKAIRDQWPGSLVIKGILDPAEAEACIALGAEGIVVSNHGGRQLDAAPSAASVLPAIRSRVGRRITLLADGGIRSGLDIARMMALGADAVLVGRPFVSACAALGPAGAAHVMDILRSELECTLRQLGCTDARRLPDFLHGA